MPFREEAEMLFGIGRRKKRMEYNTILNCLFSTHSGADGVTFEGRHHSRCMTTRCISPRRYLLSHCRPEFQTQGALCLRSVILDQPQSQVQGLVLIALSDLDPASQRNHFPSCMLGSLEVLEFIAGGGCEGESADSRLCSVRGP